MVCLRLVISTCLLLLAAWPGGATVAHAQETWTTLPSIATSDNTGEKPQSKVWFNGHTFWTALPTTSVSPSGTWLFRLETNNTWTPVLQLTSLRGRTDTLAVGNVTHVLVAGPTSSQLVSIEFLPASNTYQPWSVRPSPTSVYVGETGTIAIDSTGKMWLATESATFVEVYHSDYPYTSFSGPIYLATDTDSGDINAVVAMPNNTIGVFWSNFAQQRFGFRVHQDGTDPTVWLADETPALAFHPNQNMADDHLNLAVASDGTLYAAVKAGHASSTVPLLYLLVRRPQAGGGGTWDDLYGISSNGTRPIVVLNEDTKKLRVFYSVSDGIYMRESAQSPISFGAAELFLSGSYNNPTSTKQIWSGRLVVLAASGSTSGVLVTTNPGLVGYWKMDEASGTQLKDSSGWGNNATVSGSPAWTPVADGYAMTFNGTTHAVVSDQLNLNATTALSLSAWIKPNLLATQDVISRATFGSVNGYALSLLSNGKVSVHFNQATSGDLYRLDSTTSYPTSGNTWMHVAATYDGSTMRLYINGVQEDSGPGPGSITASTLSVGIGGQSNGSRRFRGDMDDVRIYNRAVTVSEISALFNNGPVKADLMVTMTDSVTTVYSGLSTVTYNIQVTNLGPSNVPAATVIDSVSSKLTGVTWTCTASSGSSCPSSGSGSINHSISLEAGDSAFYTLQGTVAASATGTLSNTASVSAPGINDPVPGNNSATDVNTIEQAVAPTISTQPPNVTVAQPNAATFSVTATGTAPLSYQWRRNGVDISGATSSSYVLNPTSAASDHGAQFSVVISNIAGNVTSSAATLTVNVAPSITTQPAPVTVFAPLSATFTVVAAGTTPLSYQWRRNGAAISGANGPSYVLSSTALSDSGAQFTVVVTNALGSVTSSPASLTVNTPPATPTITTQPASTTAVAPAAASFSVAAVGDAPLSYQWRRNGVAISGATSSSYTLSSTTALDNGAQYSVVVSNSVGSATSAVATLTVVGGGGGPTGPIFDVHFTSNADGFTYQDDLFRGTNQPSYASGNYTSSGGFSGGGLRVLVGGINSTLINNMSGGWRRSFTLAAPTPLTLTFRYRLVGTSYESDEFGQTLVSLDGTLYGVAPNDYVAQISTGSTGWQLVTLNLGTVPAGTHTLALGGYNNKKNSSSETSEILIDDVLLDPVDPVAPSVTTPPANVTVTEPAAATFSVVATGDAPLNYQWQRNGVDIGGATSSSYTLNPTAVADSGAQFSVRITNGAGTVTSTAATLTVNAANPPSITTHPASATVTALDPATFSVSATGDAPLSYQWRRNGVNIAGATSTTYVLSLTTTADDGAQFDVVVSNPFGSATSAVATLTVVGGSAPTGPIFDVHFTSNADGFTYQDDLFRGTNQPSYASGNYISSGGFSGGALRVLVGGINSTLINNMSGGWRRSFTLAAPAQLTLTFRYRLVGTSYESDEFGQTLVSLDGTLYGVAPNDYVAQISTGSTGWQLVTLNFGTVAAGTHTLALGGYNNKKNSSSETSEILIDDLLLSAPAPVPPGITTQPANLTVTEPAQASFSVVATGDALSYQWKRNGTNISGATSASHVLNPTAMADNGAQFSVVVTNAAGSVTSATATLTVNPAAVPPSITTQPANQTVTAPAPASFSVAVTGDQPMSYQWRRNGLPISGATSSSYVLTSTSAADNGAQFSVVVSNASGTVTSAAGTLTVLGGGGGSGSALFEAYFTSDSGGFTYLDDVFEESEEPDYASGALLASGGYSGGGLQVLLGGVDGSNISEMSGGWQRSFTLAAATPATLSFRYKLSGINLRSERFGQVLVSLDGALRGVPPDEFIAQVFGASGGLSTTTGWQQIELDLGTLPAGTHVLILGGFLNNKSRSDESVEILIDEVRLFDGSIPTAVPPGITMGPANLTVTAPESATFSVVATGDAPLSYQWRRGGVPMGGATSASYVLSSTTVDDSGATFDVIVTNAAGTATSASATLTVNPLPVPPSIMTPPASLTVTAPGPAGFSVVATGDAPMSYQWQRNGANISGATGASYALSPTSVEDSGALFSVVVTNAAGTVTSSTATLTVNPPPVPPSINMHPASLTVIAPGAATFSVVATGDAPLSYQWRRNGDNIPGATSPSYMLSPTAGTDSGATFDVVVSNIAGSATSAAATLTVSLPPSITAQPSSLTVTAPGAATLSVVASGDAPLTYQWRRNGTDIPGATGASYVLDPTAGTDSGATFDVVVTNTAGNVVSNTATLTVNVPPGITAQPSNVTVTAPGAAAFSVVASGDAPLTYQWRRGGVNIAGATSASYVLDPTSGTDDGVTFDVVISNAGGSVTSAGATLTVNVAPAIVTQPAGVTLVAPASASFSVVASGTGPLSYQWRRDGVEIPGATNASYVLNPTAGTDNGASFDVVVSNSVGNIISGAATLTVKVAPSIVTPPANVTVTAPGPATFSVVASGDAPLSYQWRRNGTNIDGATSPSFTLDPTAVDDSGATFDVVVSNTAGSVTSSAATLTVNATPLPPSITVQPASVTVTAPAPATLSVSATGDAPITYQWRRNGANIDGATSASYVLNPTAGTDDGATFDVVLTNAVGSVTSEVATLTVNVTPGIVTPPADFTVNAPNAATFTVAASGTAPLSYQWRRNGINIDGATNASYQLATTAGPDNGVTFDVVVSNVAGSVTSSAATLTVNVAPAIVTQPAITTVAVPAAATFTVVASGTAPLTYQWRRNGEEISGATGASYVLDPSAAADNGATFDVVVTNSVSSVVSSPAMLTVHVPPSITMGPSNTTVTAPNAANFSVTATGDAPMSYQWRRNGSNISGANAATYAVNPTTGSDDGATFDVIVSNAGGSITSAAATLTVNVTPSITTAPANAVVVAPAAATFSVAASGTGPLSYQWRRNGVDIPGANSASYVLDPTAETDGGATFDVVVSNAVGFVVSPAATLTVNVGPAIVTAPVSATVTAPAPAGFSVVASGTGPLSYQWRRNGVIIAGANGTSYVVDPTAGSDSGATFDVVVSNTAGSVTSPAATLTVNVAPGITTQPASVTVVAPASATFTVVATGTGPLSYQWRRDGVNIGGATSSSYVLNPTAESDSGATFDVVLSNAAGSVTSSSATLTVQVSGTTTVLETHFEGSTDGFTYVDDLFRGTLQPTFASGALAGSGGFSGGGAQVLLGGVNSNNTPNISGGWQASFTMPSAGEATLTFRYKLSMINSRTDRYGEILASLNGVLKSAGATDYIVRLYGTGGGGTSTTGWQEVQISLGSLTAGNHVLALGSFLSRKSASTEFAEVFIDDVTITVAQ